MASFEYSRFISHTQSYKRRGKRWKDPSGWNAAHGSTPPWMYEASLLRHWVSCQYFRLSSHYVSVSFLHLLTRPCFQIPLRTNTFVWMINCSRLEGAAAADIISWSLNFAPKPFCQNWRVCFFEERQQCHWLRWSSRMIQISWSSKHARNQAMILNCMLCKFACYEWRFLPFSLALMRLG